MDESLAILSRWLHVASAVAVIGGIFYARLVVVPAMRGLAAETQESLSESLAARYRWIFYSAVCFLLVSGVYNLMNKKGTTPLYHAIIGVKMLVALHVFAVGFLIVQPKNPRRARQMMGVIISGLVILALSALLRHISLYGGL